MSGFDVLNEILAALNDYQKYENIFLPPEQQLEPLEPIDIMKMVK